MSTLTARIDLPPVAGSVPVARHVVVDLLRVWGARQEVDDAALLITELVANVVDHAGGEAGLTVEVVLAGEWLRISVADGSAVRPVVRELEGDAPRGRGMQLVQAVADRWGSEDHQGGKRIWFELRAPLV
ncbi:ATP-binding protein [Geodermatophilus sp. YIM 151500]|uniref:ATP-binding protein n=1 Tax=Geodermatophilus sp. YIM 151500 TaxID=2984531 RepID=UPI0021E3FF60|nr:ATP-binding protein [Geodermatophilus sp. YIM 151500]MCV2490340.1 ATP-binding protein [Geodermatophilus sp. YIM 151500]